MDYFHLNASREELLNMSSLGLAHLGDGVLGWPTWGTGCLS